MQIRKIVIVQYQLQFSLLFLFANIRVDVIKVPLASVTENVPPNPDAI